jgi:hypothetical protein
VTKRCNGQCRWAEDEDVRMTTAMNLDILEKKENWGQRLDKKN